MRIRNTRSGAVVTTTDEKAGRMVKSQDWEVADNHPAPASASPPMFDPSEHSVAEVKAYLVQSSRDEAVRVIEAELAGKARTTIVNQGKGDVDG